MRRAALPVDPQPNFSINQLKSLRKNPHAKHIKKKVNETIKIKQFLYFHKYQYIPGFKWGMNLRKSK